jgi:hypothetical protein
MVFSSAVSFRKRIHIGRLQFHDDGSQTIDATANGYAWRFYLVMKQCVPN